VLVLANRGVEDRLGGYHVRDIAFSAAFDVDANKVGRDLSEALFAPPNNTIRFAEVPPLGVPVRRGMTHDGLGKYLSQVITKAPGPTANIVSILQETDTDVVSRPVSGPKCSIRGGTS
jgi:myo-inositol-1-phosphate synthase